MRYGMGEYFVIPTLYSLTKATPGTPRSAKQTPNENNIQDIHIRRLSQSMCIKYKKSLIIGLNFEKICP